MKISTSKFIVLSSISVGLLLVACGKSEIKISQQEVDLKTEKFSKNNERETIAVFPNNSNVKIQAIDGHEYSLSADGVMISSNFKNKQKSSGKTEAVRFVLPTDIEKTLKGKKISINVVTASPDGTPLDHKYMISYSTHMNGNSGWMQSNLLTENVFEYQVPVPPIGREPNLDYLGVISDISGAGKPIVIKAIDISIEK